MVLGDKIPLQYLTKFLNKISTAIVLVNAENKIIFSNKLATIFLKKHPKIKKILKNVSGDTKLYKNTLVKDYPFDDLILRFYAEYLSENASFIFIAISDISRQWYAEKQKELLEFTAISASQDMPTEEWLQAVLSRLEVMLGVQNAGIRLFNYQSKEPTFEISVSGKKEALTALGEGITGLAALKQQPLAINNTHKDKRYSKKNGLGDKPGSLLVVPMKIDNNLLGVLEIYDKPDKYFREQDRIFYSILANRLSLAISQRSLIEKLKQGYARLFAVIHNTQQANVLIGSRGQILMANPAFSQLLQTDWENLNNEKLANFLPELQPLLLKKQKKYSQELQLTSIEGNPWIRIYVSKILREENVRNIVLTMHDITAERQLEQLKNDFVATAAHELRAPLTAVRGYLDMLTRHPENLNDKQKQYLKRMDASSNNLFKLVEDLLSVLRIDQDSVHLRPARYKLLPVVRETVNSLEAQISNKRIKVVLPEKDFYVYADVSALQRILVNLIDNAVKYSRPKGKITISFEPVKRVGGRYIKVDVSDKGVGIPKHKQKIIFEKFERAPNELSVEAGGAGLGLYITKRLAEQMNGTLRLLSSSEKGSTFSLTVPANKNTLYGKNKIKQLPLL